MPEKVYLAQGQWRSCGLGGARFKITFAWTGQVYNACCFGIQKADSGSRHLFTGLIVKCL